ncbi:MAG: tetratricopeptide repeat protein [Fidelibacterota bacterium]|nr:MAG: tetratricopeptide repeat protein [Candidatus Neomarinimicrobiota bacterium]
MLSIKCGSSVLGMQYLRQLIVWGLASFVLMIPARAGGQIQDPYADALRYFELGRYERAALILQEVLEEEPECVECYDLLARIATTEGNDSLAAVWYRQALEVEPENATLYQKLGFSEHRAGDFYQAIADLEHSLELNPGSGETNFTLGNVWYDLERLDEAKLRYDRALALDSTVSRYHFQLGMVYFKVEQIDSALIEFKETYRWYPKYSLAYEFAANILITQGRWDEVVEVLELGLASAPETEVTRYWLGRAHLEVGNYERAAELLGGYVVKYMDHIGARYNYGMALYEIGEYEEAVAQLCSVAVHLPDLLKARLYLGRSLSALNRDSLAFAEFDTVLSKDPTYYEAWIDRGDIDLKRDRYDLALGQYRRANAIDPGRWESYHREGLTNYLQAGYSMAESFLYDALIRQDSVADVYDLMGDVASAMGNDDFSVYYYDMVLRLELDNTAARYKLIDAFIRRGLWREALRHLSWLYEQDPNSEGVLYRMSRVAYADGDTAAAREYLDEFWQRHSRRLERERLELRVQLDRRNPRHYEDLGWYYRRLEDHARARYYFRRAVALGDTTLPASLYLEEEEGP